MRQSNPPPTPTPDPELLRLASLMHRFMDQVNRRTGGSTLAIIHESGLTLPQMVAMHVLRRRDTLDLGAVADAIRLTASTTSHLVDRLLEKGLVERWENPGDRRQKLVRLTPAGEDVVDRISRSRGEEMSQVMAELSPEIRGRLAEVFEHVIGQLEKEGGA